MKLTKGSVVLTSSPIVWNLDSSCKGSYCDQCFKKCDTKRCCGCHIDSYCSRECQRAAWKLHKHECKLLKSSQSRLPSDTTRLLSKIIIFLKNGGDKQYERIDSDHQRSFYDLKSHSEQLDVTNVKALDDFTTATERVKYYLGTINLLQTDQHSLSLLKNIYGVMCVNCFSICDTEEQKMLGTGLYLAASVFDHSCSPNAVAVFSGTQLTIRAIQDIDDYSLDKVRISYTDLLETREMRQRYLLDKYYFTCHCERCEDSDFTAREDSFNCGSPSCNSLVTASGADKLACGTCGYDKYPPDTLHQYNRLKERCRDLLTNCMKEQNHSLAVYEDLLSRRESLLCSSSSLGSSTAPKTLLHKKNLWRTKTLDEAMEAAIREEKFQKALKFGLENVDGMRHYLGENHPTFGLFIAKLGKLCVYDGQLQDGVKYLRGAKSSLSVSIGAKNPIITDAINSLITDAVMQLNTSTLQSITL